MHIVRALRANFADQRGWAIFAQLFLGFGWMRAAVDHLLEPRWWDGSELAAFISLHETHTVDAYRPFIDELVARFPGPVSFVVLVLEFVTAALLITNHRSDLGLTIGGFLNVHFILAGQVNPSVFYLVLTVGLLLWRLEQVATPRSTQYHLRRVTALAIVVLALFGPSIRTVDPSAVIEDPALILVFLAWLSAGTIWLSGQEQPTLLGEATDLGRDPDLDPDLDGETATDSEIATGSETATGSEIATETAEVPGMELDLEELAEIGSHSKLPLVLSLQRAEGRPALARVHQASSGDAVDGADDVEQPQPRIRDLAP